MTNPTSQPRLSFLLKRALMLLPLLACAFSQASPPNVILILADDLGYGDLSIYGQRRFETPRLDRMATEGQRFTQFYAGSTVCGPSRWSLMTGRHVGSAFRQQQERLRAVAPKENERLVPDSAATVTAAMMRPFSFSEKDLLLPQALKRAGYRTAMFGKWGMSPDPEKQGFDEFLGYTEHVHAHSHFTNHLFEIQNGTTKRKAVDPSAFTQDLFMERALSFIEQNKEGPFFLYLPFALVHAELLVPQEEIAPFLDEKGQSRFLPDPPFPCCGVVGTYRGQPHPHAAFAAMVTRVDRDVGRILDRLKELGIDENTIVLFTSDNGPHNEGGADVGYFEGNGPFRGYKRDLYEGGIRVPMIAWSGGAQVKAKAIGEAPWAMWDLFPTIAQWAQAESPADIDGRTMTGLVRGEQPQASDRLFYWEYNDTWAAQGRLYSQAVRQGDWKLLRFRSDEKKWVELYNLDKEVSEYNNLARQHPEVVNRLVALLDQTRPPQE